MKISELRARENFDADLERTIRYGMEIYPENIEPESKETWFEHPFFSVYAARGFCADGRRYLKNQYRYAPKLCRRIIQAPAVEVMGSSAVFERMLKPAFETLKCGNASKLMWMPGNHRFRLFDFDRRNICVFIKSGFSTEGIEREIEFRTKYAGVYDWIIPILKADKSGTSFVEPLLETHPLDREHSCQKRIRAAKRLVQILSELHETDSRRIASSSYISCKYEQFCDAKMRVKSKFPGFCSDCVDRIWDKASSMISKNDDIEVSFTHGDFQPGNVLISSEDEHLWLIDWEDASIRARCYDAMTWELKSRFPKGLKHRIERFSGLDSKWGETGHTRELQLALWMAEDLIWHLETTSRPGIVRLSESFGQLLRELSDMGQ